MTSVAPLPTRQAALTPPSAPRRRARILVVDDEEPIRLALARYLRNAGHDVQTADSGTTALDALRAERYTLMITDVRMPGLGGQAVVREALRLDAELAIIMLSAVNDAPTATGALVAGAMDYLMKPIDLADLLAAAERALDRRDRLIEQRRVETLIREEVASRTTELEREKATLRSLTVNVAETLINAMEAKDVYLRGHSQRVAELGAAIADEMGLDPDTVEHIRLAGRVHDVGKIGIREDVLNKPGRLTPEEFAHVKDHVRIGAEILSPLKHLGIALRYMHDHHEHWDGSGYPRGLAGTEISIGGRILAAADAFDALTSKRSYREPMTQQATIEFMATLVGTLLDPEVYGALSAVVLRQKSALLTFIE